MRLIGTLSIMKDPDLIFLEDCDNEQLKTLIDILVYDKDGNKRYTESISSTQKFDMYYPNRVKDLIPEIVNEIQLFGGNTIANKLRGHGVYYREILEDVCDKMKVNYNKKLSTPLLEMELLRKVAMNAVENMSEDDIKVFDENLDKDKLMKAVMAGNGPILTALTAIIVQQVTRQAAKSGTMMLFGRVLAPRIVAFAVPVINALALAWAIYDIAGPAYRVTIPFTITTAFLRRQLEQKDSQELNLFA